MFLCQIDLGSFGRCHACAVCLIRSYIYSDSVLWKLSCQNLFFSSILSEGLEQVKLYNILKMGKIHMVLSKLRLTM